MCVLGEIRSRHLPNTNHKRYRFSNLLDRWSRNRKIPACSNIIQWTYKLLFSTSGSLTSLTKALKTRQFAFLHQFEINNTYVSHHDYLIHKRNYAHNNAITFTASDSNWYKEVLFEVLLAVCIQFIVLWDITPYRLTGMTTWRRNMNGNGTCGSSAHRGVKRTAAARSGESKR